MNPTLAACVAFLKPEEGCVLHPYQDGSGYWTIGYGNRTLINGQTVTASIMPITQAMADELLLATVTPLLTKIQAWVGRSLTDPQWAALVSFAYNLGAGTLFHSSLLTAIRAGYLDMASRLFAPYCHSGGVLVHGLVTRRAKEAAAFAGHGTVATDHVANIGKIIAAPVSDDAATEALNAAEVAAHAG